MDDDHRFYQRILTMKATIDKLFPKQTKVKFDQLDRELTVNPINLSDDAWMLNEFGGKEGIVKVFEGGDIRSLMRIFYRLLNNEDKEYIAKVELTTFDEDGNKEEIKSSIDKLLYLVGITQIEKIVKALVSARGASLPDEVINEDEKKKVKLKK